MKRINLILFCLVLAVGSRLIVPDQALGTVRLSVERLQTLENGEKNIDVDVKLLKALDIIDKMNEEEKWLQISNLIHLNDFVTSQYYDELLYLYSVHLANINDVSEIDDILNKVLQVQDSIHIFPLMLSRMIAYRNAKSSDFKLEADRILKFMDSLPADRKIHGPVIEGNIIFGHSMQEDYSTGDLPKVVTIREYMESPVPLSGFSADTRYLYVLESSGLRYSGIVYSERLAKLYERFGDLSAAGLSYSYVAENYKTAQRYDKALIYINKALALFPKNSRIIHLKNEIELALVLKNGNAPQGKAAVNASCDNSYFFDHNERLGQNNVCGRSKEELRLMRNEVFARHGRSFTSSDLQSFFSKKCWYRVNSIYSDCLLTETDRQNISILQSLELVEADGGEMQQDKE